ncbi:DUF1090 domain-containing protein [Pseudoalteromonas sp. K222D]|uniref:DUF1090 domain-containing protein n=1 Tax=Pseudoalteromonas sp. K222D TaxID=2820756 RepID=UPI001FCC5D86|nr:DUF1090 domain-containing protein [Pseudoalteromonas sp. K222D]
MINIFSKYKVIPTTAGILFMLSSTPVASSLACSDLTGCEKKFCEIESQLTIAKEHGNKYKIEGLKKALHAAKANCSEKILKEDLIEKINDANNDIAEYEEDLLDAKQAGKSDKVSKYQKKITAEKLKLKHLKDELGKIN